jgi:hypothetical protein
LARDLLGRTQRHAPRLNGGAKLWDVLFGYDASLANVPLANVHQLGGFRLVRSVRLPICGSKVGSLTFAKVSDLGRHHCPLALAQVPAVQVLANDMGQRVAALLVPDTWLTLGT